VRVFRQPVCVKSPQLADETEAWWPARLGNPSSAGSHRGLRYAFFQQAHRLLIDRDGTVTTYDSGPHRISGIYQPTELSQIRFTGDCGNVDLGSLRKLENEG
jgi:hypothetical protein